MPENLFTSSFRLIIRILTFIFCLLPIINYIGVKYENASKNNNINYFTKSRFDDFYALEKNSLDMVFIGSSHSYCTFDPENFDNELQILSHQMGTPLQHADTSYFELLEILNYQKPKIAVMELYWDVLDDDFEMKQANSFFEVLKNKELKNQYIKEVFPISEKFKYTFLPIRFQQDYFAYISNKIEKYFENKFGVSKQITTTANGIEEYRSKGYVYCDTIIPEAEFYETNQFKNFDGKDWDFSKTQKKYLDKIVELCNKNNIELIFVTAPVANVSMEIIKNYDNINKKLSEYAQSKNIKYIDYNIINKQEKLLKNKNFRDDAHLNDSGVKIVDSHFLQWLKQNSKKLN